jgi:hypothetical protein
MQDNQNNYYAGGVVSIALEQRVVDEHVVLVNSHRYLDSFLAGFFRDGGEDAPPVISNEDEKCEISVVRPKTILGVRAASNQDYII